MSQNEQLVARLKAAVATELREVRDLMGEIADTLSADHRLAMAYTEQLQAFDLAMQRAEESADLLDRIAGGSSPQDAVDAVRLNIVQDRLRAALKAA